MARKRLPVIPLKDDADETGASPETEDQTAASPEVEDDDGTADAGTKAAKDKTHEGDLPNGVKKRLERAKRRAEASRLEAAEWRRRAEEAESKAATAGAKQTEDTGGDAGAKASTVETDAVSDDPLPPDDYHEDYPEESDYVKDQADAEGLNAFLEDVDRWEQNIPLKGAAKKAKPTDGADDRGTKAAETTPTGRQGF